MIKRAWLSISRKRSKTIILGILLVIIANLVLATIFIKNATDESMKYAKSSLGGTVYLQANMEKLMKDIDEERSSENFERPEKFEFNRPEISVKLVEKIADSTYIKDYSYSVSGSANASDFDVIESTSDNNRRPQMGKESNMGDIQIDATRAYAYLSDVVNQKVSIKEGEYFDENALDKILVSYELAVQNDFAIGDKIKLENISTDETITLEIIGIYSSINESDNMMFISGANKIYMNTETAAKFLSDEDYNDGAYSVSDVTFYLNNSEDADDFITGATEEIKETEENNLILTINNSAYKQAVSPIESVGSFATTMLIIVVLASVVIISLLINNQIKERKYEIGVLMSLGETKKHITIQVLLELLIVFIAAFGLSTITSAVVADEMATNLLKNQSQMSKEQSENNFGRPGFEMGNNPSFDRGNNLSQTNIINEINIVSSFSDYLVSFALGFIIVLASMSLPAYNIMKYEPRTILTRRD